MERQLIGIDAAVAIAQGHTEKVQNVQADHQIGHSAQKLVLRYGGLISPRQRQQNRTAEDHQQIQNMPDIEQIDLKIGIVSSEQMGRKFVQHNKTSSIVHSVLSQGQSFAAVTVSFAFLRLKILLRKRMTFITKKKASRMPKVRYGFCGASVASSISGKPKTMAGKF